MAAPSARPSMGLRLNDGRILVECIAFDEDVPRFAFPTIASWGSTGVL
jgi:hypothetical protein